MQISELRKQPPQQQLDALLKTLLYQQQPPQDLRQILARLITLAAESGLEPALRQLEREVAAYAPFDD
jgi:hypothetical protein